LPMAREDHERSMWLRDRDGGVHEGFDAWRRLMAELPRWVWLARVASLPPLNLFGPALYRWIAVHRHRLTSRRSGTVPPSGRRDPDARQG
jgi:predicted DCC family thiol-disulfide oxidoreductase YuxK